MKRIFTAILCLVIFNTIRAQTLNATESVEYDNVNGRFLASNSNSIIEVDGNGNEVAFFGSAVAEYGMEVMGNALYAIVGNQITLPVSAANPELIKAKIVSDSLVGTWTCGTKTLPFIVSLK